MWGGFECRGVGHSGGPFSRFEGLASVADGPRTLVIAMSACHNTVSLLACTDNI